MEVEQTRQKTYYDYRAYGPTYKEGQQVLVFFPTQKKAKQKVHIFLKRTLHNCRNY